MRRKPQRFDRVRFREFDGRVEDAARTMLQRLPVGPVPPDEGTRESDRGPHPATDRDSSKEPSGLREDERGGVQTVLASLDRAVRRMGPLGASLAHYRIRAEGGALVLERLDLGEGQHPGAYLEPGQGPTAPPRWDETLLLTVRRIAEEIYDIRWSWSA